MTMVTDFNFSLTNVYFISLSSILLLWLTHWYLSTKHLSKLAKNIPGPKGLPIIGNAWKFIGASAAENFIFLNNASKQYKNIFKFWLGSRLLIALKNPEDIEIILSSNTHLDKSEEYDFLKPWLGNGLLTSTGDTWRAHRKLIAPTFHINILKSFVDKINVNSKITIEKLKKLGTKTFDCHEHMCEATVDILMETVMGVGKITKQNESMKYVTSVMDLNDIIHMKQSKPWLKPEFIYNLTSYFKKENKFLQIVHDLSKKIISHKKIQMNNASTSNQFNNSDTEVQKIETNTSGLDDIDLFNKKRKPFLETLINCINLEDNITEQVVKEQVDTILFEGHDTTGAGSSFFLSLMGIHQHVQQKIVDELYEIFGDSDRPATFADTLEMKYLERCILETLRLYPPVPLIARELREDVKLVSGDYTIPRGSTVLVGIYWLHHDPEIFPDPYAFNPDHHLPEKTIKRNYYSFIPFSAGPRSCVGRKYAMLKLKILLSTILRNFKIYSDFKEPDFKLQVDIILKRVEGFQIRLEPRMKLKI